MDVRWHNSGNWVALVMLACLAAPSAYGLLFLALEINLPVVSLSVRDLPLYREANGLFTFYALPLGWFGTPLALAVLAICWRRFERRARWVAAILCGSAVAGVAWTNLYFPFMMFFGH